MIVRLYKARIKSGKEVEWERVVRDVALPLIRKQRGLLDVFYTWDTWGPTKEFAFVSVWNSLDDVKRFAGKDWSQPVIPEEEKPYLESARCEHFEPLKTR